LHDHPDLMPDPLDLMAAPQTTATASGRLAAKPRASVNAANP
jgi:hypothetical protein